MNKQHTQKTKFLGIYVDPAFHRDLRMFALANDTSVRELVTEAVKTIMRKRSKPADSAVQR